MAYRAPLDDFQFLLDHVVGFDRVAATDKFAEADGALVSSILTEAGRLSADVLAPLQRSGDLDPARLENGVVRTSKGYGEGYRAIAEGGWVGMAADPAFGGMGLPHTVASVVNDMMSAACLSLQLNPLMTQGQIEALEHHASDEIRQVYLPKLISGEWSGTMNLTESQAGSDVGALSAKAQPNGDGSYAVTGQKVFISWGDNDFTQNVCHLVLARLPGAVAGTKGISLFLVPKFLPDAHGEPGVRNSLSVISIEEKMGLHGSPTAVMNYDAATGFMVGPEGGGMAAMFTMMNNARLGVGIQGIGAAEGAYQQAVAFASERRQGRTALGGEAIIGHPDVRRMLAEMKADIMAARAIALDCAVAGDLATATGDAFWTARAALLTPIAKAFGTQTGVRVTDTAIQVHGGMGYVEETGIAQFARDVRVTAIYEGTNGIQSIDLVGRKLMDGGETIFALIDEIDSFCAETGGALADQVAQAAQYLRGAAEWMLAQGDMTERLWGSWPFLMGMARVLGGYYHLKAAQHGPARARLAAFYVTRMMPDYAGHLAHATAGAADLRPEDFELA